MNLSTEAHVYRQLGERSIENVVFSLRPSKYQLDEQWGFGASLATTVRRKLATLADI
jgi:hypothetical protein